MSSRSIAIHDAAYQADVRSSDDRGRWELRREAEGRRDALVNHRPAIDQPAVQREVFVVAPDGPADAVALKRSADVVKPLQHAFSRRDTREAAELADPDGNA